MNDILREIVLPRLDRVRPNAGGYMACCPAHPDGTASLSISEGKTHPVVFHCHAGCQPEDICTKLGLDFKDLSKPREDRPAGNDEWTPAGPAVAVYDYRDENGNLLLQVCRTADKQFRQRRPDPSTKTGWAWKVGDVRKVLYKLPKVIDAVANCREIYIVEGEKDVHTLEAQGLVATCNVGGAGKWLPEYTETLRDAVITIIADKDQPGQAHARMLVQALTGVAAYIRVTEAAVGKDATDHFTAGKTLDDLEVTWVSETPAAPDLAPDLWDFLATEDSPHDWVVPDLLERGDRLILTGFEGLGKSMLVRQLAVCIAAGIHPFQHEKRFAPAKVLVIDCENSESQSRRKLRPIAAVTKYLNQAVPAGGLRLIHKPAGLDLTRAEDAAWLMERVTAHQPDVLFIGPFYRLHNGNMNDEIVARRTVMVLDAARAITNCVLITEAHAGHGEQGKGRSVRPTGSSLLLRWPEFGYGLAPNGLTRLDDNGRCLDVDFVSWRGPRDDRDWPTHLRHGKHGHMPWESWKPPPAPTKKEN